MLAGSEKTTLNPDCTSSATCGLMVNFLLSQAKGDDMKIEISWSEHEFRLRDLPELVEKHAESAVIDGDKQILVIENPNSFLIDELKNRGIRFKEEGDWRSKIKDLLVNISLYQLGKYPAKKLEPELTQFLEESEKKLCEAIRKNGGICYREELDEFSPEEAEEEVKSQIENFKLLGKTGEIIAILLNLSLEFKHGMSLSDKILLFDKVVHAEHAAGAFKEYLAEEKSIFGVNVTEIKREADKELESILRR